MLEGDTSVGDAITMVICNLKVLFDERLLIFLPVISIFLFDGLPYLTYIYYRKRLTLLAVWIYMDFCNIYKVIGINYSIAYRKKVKKK